MSEHRSLDEILDDLEKSLFRVAAIHIVAALVVGVVLGVCSVLVWG